MALTPKREKENFVSILSSDATLRKVVPEGTVGAIKREYTDKEDNVHVKHEFIFEDISGLITKIEFVETKLGRLLQVTLYDFPESEILSLSVESSYGEDFMKKLPSIDLSKEVLIKPYSFIPEGKTKPIRGLSITQEGVKIKNYFYDAENKKNIHDFPEHGDTKGFMKDDWKMYFLQVRKFLVFTTQNFVGTYNQAVSSTTKSETVDDLVDEMEANSRVKYPDEDISPDDIPF